MSDLPTKADLVSGATTEAAFQAALGSLYDYLSELVVGSVTPEVNSIVLGVVEPTMAFLQVDTESNTATDDLDRIDPSTIGQKVIFVKSESASRVVTLKHLDGGTGQMFLAEEVDLELDHPNQMIAFWYDVANTRWVELWRNFGLFAPTAANKADVRAALGLGTAATVNTGTSSGNVPLNSHLGALAYLAQITSAGQISNGVITNALLANNEITLSKLATVIGNANSLVSFNASGVPSIIAAPGGTTTVLRGDLTFGVQASGDCVLLGEVDFAGTSGGAVTWYARTDIKSIYVEFTDVFHYTAQNLALYVHRNSSLYSGSFYYSSGYSIDGLSGAALQGSDPLNIGSPTTARSYFNLGALAVGTLQGGLFFSGLSGGPARIATHGFVADGANRHPVTFNGWVNASAQIVNGITISRSSSGNFLTGIVRVWGFK